MLHVLVVTHSDQCGLGRLRGWLVDAGISLDEVRPYAGEVLPAALDGYGGLIVLGGPMGADDDGIHPWLTPTKALLGRACYGTQFHPEAGPDVVRGWAAGDIERGTMDAAEARSPAQRRPCRRHGPASDVVGLCAAVGDARCRRNTARPENSTRDRPR